MTQMSEDGSGGRTRRLMTMLPPGGTLTMDQTGNRLSIPVWLYWLQLAQSHAADATKAILSDAMVDNLSLRLFGSDVESVDMPPDSEGVAEMKEAMEAISAAAHAIDGFYGVVKPLVNPPKSAAKRHRQILETLKLGFAIGPYQNSWLGDLDWLFTTRDGIVHHAEDQRPLVVARITEATILVSSPEAYRLSAPNAQRAAMIAQTLIETCLAHPKASIAGWAQMRQRIVSADAQSSPDTDTERT